MNSYLNMINKVQRCGEDRGDRTGTGTRSYFGYQFRHRMSTGFPLLTTKKLHWKSIVHELLWMISGDTNIKYLKDNGVRIWNEWADKNGDLGRVYGQQWRGWSKYYNDYGGTFTSGLVREGVDQLEQAIDKIKDNPEDRRIIVSAWNPGELDQMALPPCHMFFQFYCHTDGGLSLQMYQRSADIFLGVPFNIASYALLLKLVAQVTDRTPKELIIDFGDLHIYENHKEQITTQLGRRANPLPTVALNPEIKCIDDFKYSDIELQNYSAHPSIKAQVAV